MDLDFRLKAYQTFLKTSPTHWATEDLNNADFDIIPYYLAKDNNSRFLGKMSLMTSKYFWKVDIPEQEENSLRVSKLNLIARQPTQDERRREKEGVLFVGSTKTQVIQEIFKKWFERLYHLQIINSLLSIVLFLAVEVSFIYLPV